MRIACVLVFVASICVSLTVSGCLALAVPSLAYTGYQYKTGTGPFAQQQEKSSSPDHQQKKATANSTRTRVPDSQIE